MGCVQNCFVSVLTNLALFNEKMSFCSTEEGKSKGVQTAVNILGAVPLVGTGVGVVQIFMQIMFGVSDYCYDLVPKDENKQEPLRARARPIKLAQGAAELVPIVGPLAFWALRGSYLACCNTPVEPNLYD